MSARRQLALVVLLALALTPVWGQEIKHRFTSPAPPTTNPDLIGSLQWNQSMVVTGGTNGQVFIRDSTAADGWRWGNSTVTGGGTGFTSYTIGDLLFADSTNSLAKLAAVADGNVLRSAGVAVAPIWGKVRISGGTTDITGVLAAGNGGTGQFTYTIGDLLVADSGTSLSRLAAVAVGSMLRATGVGAVPAWSTTTWPNAATTGDVLHASGANAYANLAAVADGNVLRSAGVTTAPLWGKVRLSGATTDITGTLGVGNGGTGSATTFTQGSVIFAGASGVYSQDNANLFYDAGNIRLGIREAVPIFDVQVVGADAANTIITIDSYGTTTQPNLTGRHARNTKASPQAVIANDPLLVLAGRGFGSTVFTSGARARIQFQASQTWTDANNGSQILLETTPDNSATIAERMRIGQDGFVGIGTLGAATSQLHVKGTGQATASPSTSTTQGGTLLLQDSAGGALNGGLLVFGGTSTGAFAAIKGLLSDASNNTLGHISFATRNVSTDSTLTERMRINFDGNIAIGSGAPAPDSLLHVWKATAGSVAAISNTVLTVENSTDAFLSILSPATSFAGIEFGSPTANNRGALLYDHNTDAMLIRTAGTTDRVKVITGVQVGAPTGGDKGSGTVNAASTYYLNGAALSSFVAQHLNFANIASGVTNYATFGSGTFDATETNREMVVPKATVVRALYIRTTTSQPGTGSFVITLRKNAVDTAVIITIASAAGAGTYSDLAHTASYAAGDILSVKFLNNAATGSAAVATISIAADS